MNSKTLSVHFFFFVKPIANFKGSALQRISSLFMANKLTVKVCMGVRFWGKEKGEFFHF